jgi:hypothetical protein
VILVESRLQWALKGGNFFLRVEYSRVQIPAARSLCRGVRTYSLRRILIPLAGAPISFGTSARIFFEMLTAGIEAALLLGVLRMP